ncbi:MAG TPA: hypothetical protein VK050_01285 [Flavobacteriaceae bacterium]|nr:hypothetical protein [Flavobacteriaceae bacterium]
MRVQKQASERLSFDLVKLNHPFCEAKRYTPFKSNLLLLKLPYNSEGIMLRFCF